jgi:pimeloyl-ACP methyl ester carboxylesterase
MLKQTTFLILMLASSRLWAQAGLSGQVVVNDSLSLYYEFFGTGKDTVVIPDGQYIYPYVRNYWGLLTLLVFDVRDRGKSSALKTGEAISIQGNAADIEAVRAHFKMARVNLLGWSYMGAVCALYAGMNPDKVNSLMLMTPMSISKRSNSKMVNKGEKISKYRAELTGFVAGGGRESDPATYARLFWKNWLAPLVHDVGRLDEYVDKIPVTENESPANVQSNLGTIFSKLGDWDFADMASKIRCRTLIMYGRSDQIPVENSTEWSVAIPGSRLVEFSESGHLPFAEEPQKWSKTIETFFHGGWPSGAVKP